MHSGKNVISCTVRQPILVPRLRERRCKGEDGITAERENASVPASLEARKPRNKKISDWLAAGKTPDTIRIRLGFYSTSEGFANHPRFLKNIKNFERMAC